MNFIFISSVIWFHFLLLILFGNLFCLFCLFRLFCYYFIICELLISIFYILYILWFCILCFILISCFIFYVLVILCVLSGMTIIIPFWNIILLFIIGISIYISIIIGIILIFGIFTIKFMLILTIGFSFSHLFKHFHILLWYFTHMVLFMRLWEPAVIMLLFMVETIDNIVIFILSHRLFAIIIII